MGIMLLSTFCNSFCLPCVPGKDYIKQGKYLVDTFGDRTLALCNPADVKWMICGLQGTSYFNRKEVVEGWGKFYLPDEVRMQVVGLVKGTSCPCELLVLMICEDGKLYAYDEEELHEVASSLEQLCTEGLQYPSSLCYYKGETFSKMVRHYSLVASTSKQGSGFRSTDGSNCVLFILFFLCRPMRTGKK
uniref:Uncharacterized protein n=1 Tax=Labrus bergylta TaxID=56723 RepID=A0A3Q3GHJ0_9LABR